VLPLLLAGMFALPPVARSQPPAQPQAPDQLRTLSRDELDVIKVLTGQERAWNENDLDVFLKGYKDSPETVFLGDHVIRGFADLTMDYKKNFATKDAMGNLAFSELEPRILDGHYAIVTGKYHLDRAKKFGGSAEGFFSDVFEKTDKGWKIVLNHTT
jgi:hypothetical protein